MEIFDCCNRAIKSTSDSTAILVCLVRSLHCIYTFINWCKQLLMKLTQVSKPLNFKVLSSIAFEPWYTRIIKHAEQKMTKQKDVNCHVWSNSWMSCSWSSKASAFIFIKGWVCSHCTCGKVPRDNGGNLSIQILLWLHKVVVTALFTLIFHGVPGHLLQKSLWVGSNSK